MDKYAKPSIVERQDLELAYVCLPTVKTKLWARKILKKLRKKIGSWCIKIVKSNSLVNDVALFTRCGFVFALVLAVFVYAQEKE